jgi:hypothetical protein
VSTQPAHKLALALLILSPSLSPFIVPHHGEQEATDMMHADGHESPFPRAGRAYSTLAPALALPHADDRT